MANYAHETGKTIPAQLSFLTIYNTSIGTTDDTFKDQVLFYYSRAAQELRRQAKKDDGCARRERAEEDEKLRQIGLAQGMVEFARYGASLQRDMCDTWTDRYPEDSLMASRSTPWRRRSRAWSSSRSRRIGGCLRYAATPEGEQEVV